MAEWFKAPVLKTGDPQGSVGSNPTPSARLIMNDLDRDGHPHRNTSILFHYRFYSLEVRRITSTAAAQVFLATILKSRE
jgi:hypothetical protein